MSDINHIGEILAGFAIGWLLMGAYLRIWKLEGRLAVIEKEIYRD